MPFFTWLTSTNATSSATSPTCGSATVALYQQAMQRSATNQAVMFNQTAVTGGNTVSWYGLGSQTTSTATTGGGIWFQDDQGIMWHGQEAMLDQAQYLMLARQRQEQRALEMAALREREQIAQQRALARSGEAVARSRELLLQHLTPAQRKTFIDNNWFVIRGGNTGRRYRIRTTSYTHNIDAIAGHDDEVAYRLCGHLRGDLPMHDHHIAQKISLEYDEEAFVRLCNRSAA